MTLEELQRENEYLRTILEQKATIEALTNKYEIQHSTSAKFRQIFIEMLGCGMPLQYRIDSDYDRAVWATYSRWFDRIKAFFPNLKDESPEFKEILDKMEEWDKTVYEMVRLEREAVEARKSKRKLEATKK